MHILVDGRCLHRHSGGIGQATRLMLQEMGLQARGHRITALLGGDCPPDIQMTGVHFFQVDAAMIDESFEQFQLPDLLPKLGVDVYLNMTFSVPALKTCAAQIAVIHDVVFEDHPDWVEPRLRQYLCGASRSSAALADRIITVSDHARARIGAVYQLPPERIIRIYNGIPPARTLSHVQIHEVLNRHTVVKPYILYIGSIEMKKGIIELLRAFPRIDDRVFDGDLVLVGATGGPKINFDDLISASGCPSRIKHLGYVSEHDKEALLQAATLLVYPSLYEGFGIPPLEAMIHGTPCVVSKATSLPEVVGDAALMVDVCDIPAFAHTLTRGVADQSFRDHARIAGPLHARKFSWGEAANSYLDVCETAASEAHDLN